MQFCAQARFAVGTLSSNVGRLILLLHQGQKNMSSEVVYPTEWFTSMDYSLNENFHPMTGWQWFFDNGKQDFSDAIWHIPTPLGGIASHYKQLESIFLQAQSYGRRVIELNFHSSKYYPTVAWVSLCDIFEFPMFLTCSNMSYADLCKNQVCNMIGSLDG